MYLEKPYSCRVKDGFDLFENIHYVVPFREILHYNPEITDLRLTCHCSQSAFQIWSRKCTADIIASI